MKLLELSGGPFERGERHGRCLRDVIAQVVEDNYRSLAQILAAGGLPTLTKERYHAMALRGLPYAEEYAPDLVKELRGLAEGSGLSFEEICGLNYWLDLVDTSCRDLTNGLLFGCTTLAATNTATGDNAAYLGQNFDLRSLFQKGTVLLRLETAPGVVALVFAIAGTVGCAGMNSAGIGTVINKVVPSDSRPGVPYTFVLRKALAQTRLADAVSAITSAHRASGVNYLMADHFGQIINLEVTATDLDVVPTLEEWIGHSNHYVHPRLAAAHQHTDWPSSDSYLRWSRINTLLKQQAGTLTKDRLMDILRDHSGYPQGICRHPIEGLDELQSGNTIASILMDLRTLRFWISTSNPCQNPYEEFGLDTSVPAMGRTLSQEKDTIVEGVS